MATHFEISVPAAAGVGAAVGQIDTGSGLLWSATVTAGAKADTVPATLPTDVKALVCWVSSDEAVWIAIATDADASNAAKRRRVMAGQTRVFTIKNGEKISHALAS